MSETKLISKADPASLPDFGAKILGMAHELAQWTELPEGLMCTYFSPAHKAAAAQLRDWMAAAGFLDRYAARFDLAPVPAYDYAEIVRIAGSPYAGRAR